MSVETQTRVEPHDHIVQFYERDEQLIATVSAHLGDGLRCGEVAIVVATPAHTVAFEAALNASGVDVTKARQSGTLITLDASETLSMFMADDGPDATAFDNVIGGVVRRAAQAGRPIRAYGEMVALLWDAGHVTAAIELESLWNDLGRQISFSLFCAYPMQSVADEGHSHAFQEVCQLHSAIVPNDSPPSSDQTVPAVTEEARRFTKGPHAPRAARRFVVDTLEQWGREELVDDAAMIVSELATNAVIHAQSDFTVAISALDDGVRITVGDASSAPPILRDLASVTAPSGRGLALVATMAHRWGSDLIGDRKAVWAEFR